MLKEIVSKLLGSASKLVLLGFAAAMIVALFTNHVSEETFKLCAVMVFTYYFTQKGDPTATGFGK